MLRSNHNHSYSNSSSQEDNQSPSQDRIQHESQFHTFAANKGKEGLNRKKQSSSQQQDDSEDEQILKKSSDRNLSESASSDNEHNKNDQQSFDIIEARIKKLENELSRKLKKISPERQIDKPNGDSIKRPLKSKYSELDNVVIKENDKKQPISPRHKKIKSKQIKTSATLNSNQSLPTKHGSKRVNETYQLKTIEQGKPNKASTRKLTQSQQGNFKQQSYKQTIEDLKKQNDQLKSKLPSKSKKKSCVQKQIEDMDYLKSKMSSNGMTKLQKQIQLLKIVQSIRVKLKRSINHKLNKMYPDNDRTSHKSKISTFLLHRGCPANYLN